MSQIKNRLKDENKQEMITKIETTTKKLLLQTNNVLINKEADREVLLEKSLYFSLTQLH